MDTSTYPAGQHGGRPGPPADPAGHPSYRGRSRDPLYRTRKLRLTAAEQLPHGDERGSGPACRLGIQREVAAAWQGKELLRAVDAAAGMPATLVARERFDHWVDCVGVAELSRLARTVKAWEAEILAWHVTGGCSNGPTEAGEPADQEGQAGGARLPELRQLPPTAAAALWRQVADAPNREPARTPTPGRLRAPGLSVTCW